MASNPFKSAKDSLLSLFEEYRKKVCYYSIIILFLICSILFLYSMK